MLAGLESLVAGLVVVAKVEMGVGAEQGREMGRKMLMVRDMGIEMVGMSGVSCWGRHMYGVFGANETVNKRVVRCVKRGFFGLCPCLGVGVGDGMVCE